MSDLGIITDVLKRLGVYTFFKREYYKQHPDANEDDFTYLLTKYQEDCVNGMLVWGATDCRKAWAEIDQLVREEYDNY